MNYAAIDAHTHILPPIFREQHSDFVKKDATYRALFDTDPPPKTASADDLVRELDASGARAAVALGYGWTDYDTARLSNDYLLESAAKHSGRIYAFCSVNPLWGERAVSEIARCADAGALGVGELHADTQNLLSQPLAQFAPFMAICRERNLPVLLHGSEPIGHSYPGKGTATPDILHALVTSYPENKFICAHFGGGLPFYALMPEVKKSLQNVWFDSAAYNFLYDAKVFTVAGEAFGYDKLLFGSDFPLVGQRRALDAVAEANPHIGESDMRAILGGNAAKLLSII